MKKIAVYFLLIIGLTSCQKETIEEDPLSATDLVSSVQNCSDVVIHPLWYGEPAHSVSRFDQNCNPVSSTCFNYYGYVASTNTVPYDRYVEVFYEYKADKTCSASGSSEERLDLTYNGDNGIQAFYTFYSPNNYIKKLEDGIIAVETYKIPANASGSVPRYSKARPILYNVGAEANGTVTSYVASVQANGEILDCYSSSKITNDFINCYQKSSIK